MRLALNEKRQLTCIKLNVPPPLKSENSPLFENICAQLTECFDGGRKIFTLPPAFNGTLFETRVAKALLDVPCGETRSRKDIATACGNSEAARAVGQAVYRNNLPIAVPCYRIIGASGSLIGFGRIGN